MASRDEQAGRAIALAIMMRGNAGTSRNTSTAREKAPCAVSHRRCGDAGSHAFQSAPPPRPRRDYRLGRTDYEQRRDRRNHRDDQALVWRNEEVTEHWHCRASEI